MQVCFGADGSYQGTRTYDGYPVVSDDGMSFTVKGEFDVMTVRDAGNAIVQSISGSGRPMIGTRMTPGNAGFASYQPFGQPGERGTGRTPERPDHCDPTCHPNEVTSDDAQ